MAFPSSMLKTGLVVCALFSSVGAFAADDEDALDDILNDPGSDSPTEESAREEREAVESGEADTKAEFVLPEESSAKRIIKTLPKKTFMKIGRYELSPHIGFITNDPFVKRYLVGASLTYHPTEIFGIELSGTFSPDFGESDWTILTKQLINENSVSPDISKVEAFGSASFQFSPIYGKVAVAGKKIVNFDIFGVFGAGVVSTKDDLKALQAEGDAAAIATETQVHPTTNLGGGFRIIFNENMAVRVEGRSLVFIETVESTTLEMKNNFALYGSFSFFFPNMD